MLAFSYFVERFAWMTNDVEPVKQDHRLAGHPRESRSDNSEHVALQRDERSRLTDHAAESL